MNRDHLAVSALLCVGNNRRAGLWLTLLPLLWHVNALAATVIVNVTDSSGKPLPQAVVSIEPTTGKLVAQPTPTAQVAQFKRQFQPQVTVVTAGTPVLFPNFDTVRHHVYSFSPIKTFELKLYAGVPNVPVLFDRPGIAVIGCNIHDNMAAWIVVVDTPFFGLTGADGRARINAVAAGSYRLKVWHPGLSDTTDGVASALTVGNSDLDQAVRLNISANPLVPLP
jgi:plastocyanin